MGGPLHPTPSPIFSSPRAPHSHSTPHPAPSRGEKVWVQPSLRAPIPTQMGKGEGNHRTPLPLHLSPEFPLHTPSDSDLGSGGRLSWKRFPLPRLWLLGCLRRFRGPTGRCRHLPVGISAAAERSNSRSRSRSPGGAAAAATAATAAANWDPLGSTALAMSGTCLRLAAVASSGARADN